MIPTDTREQRALHVLARVVADTPFRAGELLDRVRVKTREAFGFKDVEWRAPNALVHGIAATLHARIDDLHGEQVHALLGTLVQQTDRLRDLADQLLDLSRIESGAGGFAERFHPRERLDELVPRVAGERAADVHVLVDEDMQLVADPIAFERVAANLILNALRYGEAPVEVRCHGGERIRLLVEDRGPGVDPAFVPRLFDRFSRSDDTRRSGAPGAG